MGGIGHESDKVYSLHSFLYAARDPGSPTQVLAPLGRRVPWLRLSIPAAYTTR